MDELRGKVAVVTGGASGIGRGLALACADEGMDVVIGDVEIDRAEAVAAEAQAKGVKAIAAHADVTDRASMEALAARTYEEFGAAHLLCCNAGVFFFKSMADMTPADWQWLFSVNFFGVVNTIDAFLPRMRAQGGEAHILNTGSNAGLVARARHTAGYSSTKFAVVGLSELLRAELAADGIGVSVLCPSGVRTLIRASDRNRPAEFGGPVPLESHPDRDFDQDPEDGRMDPAQVARYALDAVKANRLYIITHDDTWPTVEKRFEGMRADFEAMRA
jgi:NAD(P)-dependent dehydrogenase (short-subunit alcohol dehydrogenase family)